MIEGRDRVQVGSRSQRYKTEVVRKGWSSVLLGVSAVWPFVRILLLLAALLKMLATARIQYL
jgi:hypothetical protein